MSDARAVLIFLLLGFIMLIEMIILIAQIETL